MATKRLSNRSDTYTTKDGDEFVYALKGNDKITIQGLFYDEENDGPGSRSMADPGTTRSSAAGDQWPDGLWRPG